MHRKIPRVFLKIYQKKKYDGNREKKFEEIQKKFMEEFLVEFLIKGVRDRGV